MTQVIIAKLLSALDCLDRRRSSASDQPFKSEADIYSLATAPVAPPTQAHVWRFSSSRRDCLSSQSCCGMCTVASSSWLEKATCATWQRGAQAPVNDKLNSFRRQERRGGSTRGCTHCSTTDAFWSTTTPHTMSRRHIRCHDANISNVFKFRHGRSDRLAPMCARGVQGHAAASRGGLALLRIQ